MLIHGVNSRRFITGHFLLYMVLFFTVLYFITGTRVLKHLKVVFKNICFEVLNRFTGCQELNWWKISFETLSTIIYKAECACFRMLISSLPTAMHASGLYSFIYRISTFLLVKAYTEYTATHKIFGHTFTILPKDDRNSSLWVHIAESASHTDDVWHGVERNVESSTCWLLHQH